jgi:hypothetical protein
MPFGEIVIVYFGIPTRGIHTHLNVVVTMYTTWHNTEERRVLTKCCRPVYVLTFVGRIRSEL